MAFASHFTKDFSLKYRELKAPLVVDGASGEA